MNVHTERETLKIYILEKEYQIVCEDHEREPLTKAAQYLDSKMKEIRAARKVIGAEAIAIMAALNMSHDYMQCMKNSNDFSQTEGDGGKIKRIQEKINSAILRCQNTQLADGNS